MALFSLLLTVFFSYLYGASLFHYITSTKTKIHSVNFYEIYYLVSLSVFYTLYLFRGRLRLKNNSEKYFSKSSIEFILVFSVILIFRFYCLPYVSLYFDETLQASMAYLYGPVEAGYWQHQPPLDMVFTRVAISLFNNSVWALRMHAMIFSGLAGTCLYFTIKKLTTSKFTAAMWTLIFVTQFYNLQFGSSARPISLGIFFEILFLTLILDRVSPRPLLNLYVDPVVISCLTFLSMLSVGMQPPVFIGFALGILFLISFHNRQLWSSTFIPISLGYLAALPIIWGSIRLSPPRFTKHHGIDISAIIEAISFDNYWNALAPVTNFLGVFFLTTCSIYLGYSLFRKRLKFDLDLALLFSVAILFSMFLVPFFVSHIDWAANPYYFIFVYPPIVIGSALLSTRLTNRFELSQKKPFISGIIALLIFGFVNFQPPYFSNFFSTASHKNSTRKVYEFLNEQMTSDSEYLFACISIPHCSAENMADTYYLDLKKDLSPDRNNYYGPNRFREYLETNHQINHIFWFISGGNPDSLKLLPNSLTPSFQAFGSFVFKSDVLEDNLAQSVLKFTEPIFQAQYDRGIFEQSIFDYIIVASEFLEDQIRIDKYEKMKSTFSGTMNTTWHR